MVPKHVGRCLTSLALRTREVKTTETPGRQTGASAGEDVEELERSHTADGNRQRRGRVGNGLAVRPKAKVRVPR